MISSMRNDESQKHFFYCLWHKTKTLFQNKPLADSQIVLDCFPASLPLQLTITDEIMNSTLYQKILNQNTRLSVNDFDFYNA